MQYLLTEEEYRELKRKADGKEEESRLQVLCTFVANRLQVPGWGAQNQPWGCILSTTREHVCDHCPVQDYCPYPDKVWSK